MLRKLKVDSSFWHPLYWPAGLYLSPAKRKWKGGKGILCKFVEEYLKNYESKARSLLLEFLLKNHFCVVSKEFEGISPLKINDLSNCLQVRDENEDEEHEDEEHLHLWKYFSLGRKEHSWVTFGILKLTDGGNLKIENKDQSIDILIVGSRSDLYHKVGKLVAVSNFDYVEEEFRIYGVGNITRRYITLHSKHVISLVIGMSDPLQISATTNYNLITFKLRVTSVSGLKFFKNDLKREHLNGFFVTKAYVSKEEADIAGGKKEECWSTLIRFKGSLANVHPFLSEPCVIRGKVPSENIDLHFRKQQNFSWLIPMNSQFGTCECVEAPFDFEVQSIESISLPIPSDSIATILEGSNLGSNMFNIEGTIIQKKFMTPKYESQIAEIPLKALNGGIGVPGSKLIRLLVYDTKYPEYKIWIYLSNDNQFCVSQYHLGLIPGAEIYITWLQRFVSKSNRIYLSETQFTRITVQSFNISMQQSLPTNHKFISELYSLQSGSVCLIFATLSSIMNVSLKSICPCCESDFENGACSFVGCHANEQSIIVGSAKIIVDDGSETASVFVKDVEHIKALFSITESRWNSLNKVVSEQPLNFRRKISEQPADFEVDDAQKGFASFITNPQNFRPLKIIGRIFPMRESPLSPTLLNLFALKLVPINPTAHISSLKKSN